MTGVRGLAAVVFVLVFGYFLAGPVLNSGDGAGPEPPAVALVASPPQQEDEPTPKARFPKRLLNPYPRECLRPVERPGGTGLVAAYQDQKIEVVTLTGDPVATITDVAPVVAPPIVWSPSGRYIAAGPQGLFWDSAGEVVLFANGEFAHGMVSSSSGLWAWSPIADCGVALQDGALIATTIDPEVTGAGVQLIAQDVVTFAFMPDGRRLVVTLEGTARPVFLTADLRTGRIRRGAHAVSKACRTCSPTGDFRVGIRDQRLALLDAEGEFLRFITEVQTENGVWGESAPEWGPGGTGVLFERHMHLVNQLWFIPERGSEPHFVTSLEPLAPLTGAFDWSATPPSGRPVRSVSD